jgi:hypothetical protein
MRYHYRNWMIQNRQVASAMMASLFSVVQRNQCYYETKGLNVGTDVLIAILQCPLSLLLGDGMSILAKS